MKPHGSMTTPLKGKLYETLKLKIEMPYMHDSCCSIQKHNTHTIVICTIILKYVTKAVLGQVLRNLAHNCVFTNTSIMSLWIQWIIVVPLTFSCPITLLIIFNMFKIKL